MSNEEGIVRLEDMIEDLAAHMTAADKAALELCDELINEGKADKGLFEALVKHFKAANGSNRYRKTRQPEPRALDALITYATFNDEESEADLWREVYDAVSSTAKYIYVVNSLNTSVGSSTFLPVSNLGLNKKMRTLNVGGSTREVVKVRSLVELPASDTRIISGSLIQVDEMGTPINRNVYADLQR